MTNETFWLPTIQYTLTDAINRAAAATGSPRYAAAAQGANYNGHSVTVSFNSYRKYWTAEYTWAGRVVLARGDLDACVQAAVNEYKRGAKGSRVLVNTIGAFDEAALAGHGFQPWSPAIEAAHYASFADARFALVGEALRNGTDGILANSATVEEYHVKCDTARFGDVEKTCKLAKGVETMTAYVRTKHVHFYVDGKITASYPRDKAREFYRESLTKGWAQVV
jgi:hypothetical protein